MVAEAAEGRSTGDEGCCLTIRELVAETAQLPVGVGVNCLGMLCLI